VTVEHHRQQVLGTEGTGVVSNPSSASPLLFGFCWTVIEDSFAHLVCDTNPPAGSALWPILWPPSSDSFLLVEDRNHAHHRPTSRFSAHRHEISPETMKKGRARCVRRHFHTYNCIFIHIHTFTYIYIHIHKYTCIYCFFYFDVLKPISLLYIHINTYTYIYICILLYTYI
jgi:hypothetical protein